MNYLKELQKVVKSLEYVKTVTSHTYIYDGTYKAYFIYMTNKIYCSFCEDAF